MAEQVQDSTPKEGEDNPDLEAPKRPEWLPENFENEQALLASYRESEAALKRVQQDLHTERSAREAMEQQQAEAQQQTQYQAQQNDLAARLEQAREMGDIQTELAINAYVAQQAALQAFQQAQAGPQQTLPAEFVADYASNAVARQYQDWDQYKDRAAAWLGQNDYLVTDEVASNPALLAQRLDIAYKAVKAEDLLSGKLPEQAPNLSQQKMQAQTMSGAGTRQPAPTSNEEWAREIAEANKTLSGFSTL